MPNIPRKIGYTYKNSEGYIEMKYPSHPFNHKGWIKEHRYVVEKHLSEKYGYQIFLWPKIWNIHHINGNTTDNRIENLQLLSVSQHTIIEKTGVPLSLEHCQKISKIHKGKIVSEQTKAKIKVARSKQVIMPHSEEAKAKIRAYMLVNNPMKGKKLSEEHKAKIRAWARARYE